MSDTRLTFYGLGVKDDLARLPELMRESGLEALNDAADFMVIIAQTYVLVDTGSLQSTIRKEQRGDIVSVVAGGGATINPKSGKHVDYAIHVEHRVPFMRPAWETIRGLVERLIREKVVERV